MFNFKGISSSDYVTVLTLPPFKRAQMEVVYTKVEGADFTLREEKGYSSYILPCTVMLKDNNNLDDCLVWLSGGGRLIRDGSNQFVNAFVDGEVEFKRFSVGSDIRIAKINFVILDPFKYLVDEDDFELETSDDVINQGTYNSQPRIIIEGSGQVEIDIDGRNFSYEFPPSESRVIIDGQLKDAYYNVADNLRNRNMVGDFPTLSPGSNTVTWTGSVTKVTITPNSRWL